MNRTSLLIATLVAGFLIAEALPSPTQMGATPIYERPLVTKVMHLATFVSPAQTQVDPQPTSYAWHSGDQEEA